MSDSTNIVDLIERANDSCPYCTCGWHTTPVWRDGTVWLECASLGRAPTGRLRRLLAAATRPTHVHLPIIEIADSASGSLAAA